MTVATCSCFPDCGAHEKPCTKCGRELPLTEFYQHVMMGDGHFSQCKDCVRARVRARHHEKMQDPEWRERERVRGREKFRRNAEAWNSNRDPVKRAAHVAVGNAVRDRRLIPSDACEDCGHDFSEFRREGHHEDYNRPLDVTWLCALCHGKRHRRSA